MEFAQSNFYLPVDQKVIIGEVSKETANCKDGERQRVTFQSWHGQEDEQ